MNPFKGRFLSYVNFIAGTKNEYFHFIQSTAIPVNFTINERINGSDSCIKHIVRVAC